VSTGLRCSWKTVVACEERVADFYKQGRGDTGREDQIHRYSLFDCLGLGK
jgi:hypothetical protein